MPTAPLTCEHNASVSNRPPSTPFLWRASVLRPRVPLPRMRQQRKMLRAEQARYASCMLCRRGGGRAQRAATPLVACATRQRRFAAFTPFRRYTLMLFRSRHFRAIDTLFACSEERIDVSFSFSAFNIFMPMLQPERRLFSPLRQMNIFFDIFILFSRFSPHFAAVVFSMAFSPRCHVHATIISPLSFFRIFFISAFTPSHVD